jgi:acetyl esterase/lipase
MAGEDSPAMRLLVLAFGFMAAVAAAQTTQPWPPGAGHTTVMLWPNGLPPAPQGIPAWTPPTEPEHNVTTAQNKPTAGRSVFRLGDVSQPSLTLYAAPKNHNTGAAILVFPGGGYRYLSIDIEGTEVCAWLNSIGINCVLVKYRVPDSGPWPKSAAALQDAQRAMGLVRENAMAWTIDPAHIGVLGFSAGAYLAAAVSTNYERRLYPRLDAADDQTCRPDFQMVIYPGYLAIAEQNFAFSSGIPVTAQTPPAFLVQAEDDPVHVENVMEYFLQLKKAGVPTELHVYAQGGHGYGLRPTDRPITHWPDLATKWLHTIGILTGTD